MSKTIISLSWGKDSLAMLLAMIEQNMPIDEAVFYDTGMEFEAIYSTRDRAMKILDQNRIDYVELKPDESFLYKMFDKPVNGRNGFHKGYSWCGGRCRWGTSDKIRALDIYAKEQQAQVYVGIAADETNRLQKERASYKRFFLIEIGMTEADCLELCYQHGFDWEENGIRLYDILDRVSCWCCSNKNLKELKNIYQYLPAYWERLKNLQSRTERPMKGPGKSVYDLEERFRAEMCA